MSGHLVLAGGGHAHLTVLAQLPELLGDGHRVTVIGPAPYHYYSGMGPGMLGGTYTPEQIRFDIRKIVEKKGGTFAEDRVERIDPGQKRVFLASGAHLSYDVLSLNLGSYVPNELVLGKAENVYPVKPIAQLHQARQRVLELTSQKQAVFAVAGGGPAAVEITGNLWHLASHAGGASPQIHLLAGQSLLGRFPEAIRKKVRHLLARRKIVLHENNYVQTIENGTVTLESGRRLTTDIIFLALGIKPSPVMAESGLPMGPDGGLRVNQYLQCPSYPELFGGGDCIYFTPQPLDKVGVYAVRQNPVLYHNLKAALSGEKLKPFEPGGDYLLVFNLGGGQGVLKKKGLTWSGRTAFALKDYIDRRFMKKYSLKNI